MQPRKWANLFSTYPPRYIEPSSRRSSVPVTYACMAEDGRLLEGVNFVETQPPSPTFVHVDF